MSDKKQIKPKHAPYLHDGSRHLDRISDRDQVTIDQHFKQLHRMLQKEAKVNLERYQQESEKSRPEQQEKKGSALLNLKLSEIHYSPSGSTLLTLTPSSRRKLPRFSFKMGDIVLITKKRIPHASDPVGTIYEIDRNGVTLACHESIKGQIVRNSQLNLFASANRTTYDRMLEHLDYVTKSENSQLARLRDIAFKELTPKTGDPVKLSPNSFLNKDMNEDQKLAVSKALQAEDIFIIHGPPGTGKSTVLVEIIYQVTKLNQRVLISAPSNAACDHLLDCLTRSKINAIRLGHPARMTPVSRNHTLAYRLNNHPLSKEIDKLQARIDQIYKQRDRRRDRREMTRGEKKESYEEIKLLKEEVRQVKQTIFHQVWDSADVVIATHTVAGDPLVKEKKYDWIILDESSQAIEPAAWIPLSLGGKVVMAGDHKQLPPTVLSQERKLMFSLFETYITKLNPENQVQLKKQYRMNEKIMQFPSEEFYQNTLTPGSDEVSHRNLKDISDDVKEDDIMPVIFLDTAGMGYEEETDVGTGSRYNPKEAAIIEKLYKHLHSRGVKSDQIAIISPYSAQIRYLYEQFTKSMGENIIPEIDSIDSFQGREQEIVIVSLVRSNLNGAVGFLSDVRRLNVAMTRAKRKLIMVGDSATLSNLDFYKTFIDYAEKIGGYRSAWELAE